MRSHAVPAAFGLALVVLTAATSAAQGLPVFKGKTIVAMVQGEPITLDELNRQVAAMKRDRAPGAAADRRAELALLDRMVYALLITQEARRMGFDRLPELRKMLDSHARVALRQELVDWIVKDVQADAKQVEERYRASVREWTVSAALFDDEKHAEAMAAEVSAGRDFGDVARTYLAAGKAAKVDVGLALKRQVMDPAIGNAVATMAVGSISPVIATKSGFVLVRLDDVRYPDDAAARAAAEDAVLLDQRKEAVAAFDRALKQKYVKIHGQVLESLDYEAPTPGIEALMKDHRALADIRGEKPITVGDLTEELKFTFFHGTAMAIERKTLNARKTQLLDGMLHRRVFRKEALRLKLDRTDTYKARLKDYEQSVLFDLVVRKAIAPDVKLDEKQLEAYYDRHRNDYSRPEMMRIKSLVFGTRPDAERTLESLRTGADFQWVAGRADGQLPPGTKGVHVFDGKPIMTAELPEGVRKAVAGAKAGDARLYASPESHFYVLAVQQVVAASPQPYEEVRAEIVERVWKVELEKAVKAYAEKLMSLSDVEIYLKAPPAHIGSAP
ncbi:MAG: peptidyl-prolyl cis-trans isomerase [Candidatus Rokubacteria bacterium]|nr:peptidyl-prolyl cis-trans isomerase [Candidatus Rokubacteria bacterium]